MVGQYIRCKATVVRRGKRSGWNGRVIRTLLCRDVVLVDSEEPVTDHVWFTCGRWCRGLSKGDVIEFESQVSRYVKGYRGRNWDKLVQSPPAYDYRLESPRSVKRYAPEPKA